MADVPQVQDDGLDNVPDTIAIRVREIGNVMADGVTFAAACHKLGIPLVNAYKWRERYSEVGRYFRHADEIWCEIKADELAEMHLEGINPQTYRTHSDNMRWLIARRSPKRYGDQAGKADTEERQELVSVLREAIERIPRPQHDLMKTIDAQVIDNTRQLDADASDIISDRTLPPTPTGREGGHPSPLPQNRGDPGPPIAPSDKSRSS